MTAGKRFRAHTDSGDGSVCVRRLGANRTEAKEKCKKKSHYDVTFIARTKLTVRKFVKIEFAALGCTQFRSPDEIASICSTSHILLFSLFFGQWTL